MAKAEIPKEWMRQRWNDRDVELIAKIARSLRAQHPVSARSAWQAAEEEFIRTQAPGHRKGYLHG